VGSTDHERAVLNRIRLPSHNRRDENPGPQAGGVKKATFLEAEGKAEAIRLVNEAAKQYFTGSAITLRQLEVAENSLANNTKIIVPAGQSVVNVIGGLLGIESGKQPDQGGSNPVKSLWMPPAQ